MKITKSRDDVIAYNLRRAIANDGCHKCPCCGETESALSQKNMLSDQGIMHVALCRSVRGGLFNPVKVVEVDTYKCYTCGMGKRPVRRGKEK